MNLEKLHQAAALSSDLDETKTFYEETLGARLLAYFDGPPGLLFFDFLGTRILFEKAAPSVQRRRSDRYYGQAMHF